MRTSMKRTLAVAALIVAGAACTPAQIAAVEEAVYPTAQQVQAALTIDPIVRWTCKWPGADLPLNLNTEAYQDLSPDARARCVAIPPVHL